MFCGKLRTFLKKTLFFFNHFIYFFGLVCFVLLLLNFISHGIAEYEFSVRSLAHSTFVVERLGFIQEKLINGERIIPSVSISSGSGSRTFVFVTDQGNTVVINDVKRIGFLAHFNKENARWECNSIIETISRNIPCGKRSPE
jgi:hypothetical protein